MIDTDSMPETGSPDPTLPAMTPPPWTPLHSAEYLTPSKVPVLVQARVELLALIEFCAPASSKRRLASLVLALCAWSEEALDPIETLARSIAKSGDSARLHEVIRKIAERFAELTPVGAP